MWEFLQRPLLGNPAWGWAAAAGVAVGIFGALHVLRRLVLARLPATPVRTFASPLELSAGLLRATKPLLVLVLAVTAGAFLLDFPPKAEAALRAVTVIALVLQGALWVVGLLNAWAGGYRAQRYREDPAAITVFNVVGFLGQIALWTVVVIVALNNLGVNVTALVTGMGILGVAGALAVQSILSDIFASVSIVLDKPFVLGDLILVGDVMGSVESIGLKTTRLRTPGGETLVFSNADLLRGRIRNFGRLPERRVEFTFGVSYQTPHEKAARVPAAVRKVIEEQPEARFEWAFFKEFGDVSLVLEVAYTVRSPDHAAYARVHQAVALGVLRRLQEEGVQFAHALRTTVWPAGVAPVKW